MEQRLALARCGRNAAVRSSSQTSIIAVTGDVIPTCLPGATGPFAWVGAQLWWHTSEGRIERSAADGRPLGPLEEARAQEAAAAREREARERQVPSQPAAPPAPFRAVNGANAQDAERRAAGMAPVITEDSLARAIAEQQ